MITIRQDVECMANLLPASPVPAENHFVVFKDSDDNPALFSLSRSNRLNLIIDQEDVPTLVDFGKRLGIDGLVQAFDAKQGPDLRLSVAIAVDAGNGQSDIYLVSGVDPDDLIDQDLASYIIRGSNKFPTVHDIFMSDFSRKVADKQVPLVFLAFELADKITKEDQLGFVEATAEDGNVVLKLNITWKLATNPEKIVAVTFGACRVGQGAFVLYQVEGKMKLQFRTFYGNTSSNFQVEPVCPKGATCLASFVDPKTKHSVLLVGGETITQFTSQQYVSPTSTGTTIVTGDRSLGVKGIHASVLDKEATIWYTTIHNSAHCYSAPLSSMNKGTLVPLLSEGRGGRMSGLLATKSSNSHREGNITIKTILSADRSGNLTLMQQASDSRLWRTRPFYVSSPTDNLELRGYTLRIQVTANEIADRRHIPHCSLYLVSTAYLRAVVNGRIQTLTRDGGWYQADAAGVLTVISESTDIASTLVHITNFRPKADGVSPTVTVGTVDPTEKLMAKLRGIKTGQDLVNAKTQTGEYLIKRGTLRLSDADDAVEGISKLLHLMEVKKRDYVVALEQGTLKEFFLGSLVDTVWDAFNYVEERASEALAWAVDKFGKHSLPSCSPVHTQGANLVVRFAEEVYTFAINTYETIKKGISWILAKIGVGIEKLIEFAGFIFNWQDILNTADSLACWFDAGIGFCQNKLASLEADADAWIGELRGMLVNRDTIPNANTTQLDDLSSEYGGKEIAHGVAFNWSSYQIAHGGVVATSSEDPNREPHDGILATLWAHLVKQWDIISETVQKLAKDLTAAAKSDIDIHEVLTLLTDDIIDAALDSIKNLIDTVLECAMHILRLMGELAETPIECPLFTGLWKAITGGRAFTMLNLFSLLLAVPTTVVYKLVVGIAPPVLQGRLTADTLEQISDGKELDDTKLSEEMKLLALAGTASAELISFGIMIISTVTDNISIPRWGAQRGIKQDMIEKFQGWEEKNLAEIMAFFLNMPIFETKWKLVYWFLWGIDASSKAVKTVLMLWHVDTAMKKKITTGLQFGAYVVEIIPRAIVGLEEYYEHSRERLSFVYYVILTSLDYAIKFVASGAGFGYEMFQDPEFKGTALIVKYLAGSAKIVPPLMKFSIAGAKLVHGNPRDHNW